MSEHIPFLAHNQDDRDEMLKSLGLENASDLFVDIPKKFQLEKPLNLPKRLNEWELMREINNKLKLNKSCSELISFLGGGVYNHNVPSVLESISNRGEFLTAYTPYQPEMSQGLLKAINNFLEKISLITKLSTVTCSHYDGATALAEATWMSVNKTGRKRILVSGALFPQYKKVLETYCYARGVEINYLPVDKNTGLCDLQYFDDLDINKFASLVMQSPNSFGVLENLEELKIRKDENNFLTICSMHPYLLFGNKLPDELFDILTFEGQPLGINMFCGGAHLGILACTKELRSLTPGRLIGNVSDIYGNPSLALVYEDREQHVSRDRATSNICSNQALNAIRAGAFIELYGSEGLNNIYSECNVLAESLKEALLSLEHIKVPFSGKIFNEFVIEFPSKKLLSKIQNYLRGKDILFGIDSSLFNNLQDNQILLALTEIINKDDLKLFIRELCLVLEIDSTEPIEILENALISNSKNNKNKYKNPFHKIKKLSLVPEHKVVRKFTNWSRNNFGVDTGSYPLGSCTMKYNPKRNDYFTEQQGFQKLHPFQPKETLQGIAKIYEEMGKYIAEILGMDCVDLTPAAGAHGELKGLLIARRYFEDIRQEYRNEVIIPDSAHGTNPATASMVGYKCKIIPTRSDGLMDADVLKETLSDKTAVVMTTNPSTFGVFEKEIGEIVEATHGVGALMYYDGANMNALMGITNPGLMGFDIAHLNVHKTLSTPHGGGGPGAGPVGVKKFLNKYLNSDFSYNENSNSTFIKPYFGHISVLIRAYCYIRSMGPEGLKCASQDAVLNANYLKNKLKIYLPSFFERYCMHEVLLNGSSLPIKILDLAKRMIDFDIHPPTLVGAGCVYFGEQLSNAMLFEPTESESKDELDKLVDTIKYIIQESHFDKSIAENAPSKSGKSRILSK